MALEFLDEVPPSVSALILEIVASYGSLWPLVWHTLLGYFLLFTSALPSIFSSDGRKRRYFWRILSYWRVFAIIPGVFCALLIVLIGVLVAIAPPPTDIHSDYQAALRGDYRRNVSGALVDRAERLLAQVDRTNLGIGRSGPLDIICSGGGFRGQYAGGVFSILLPLVKSGHLKTARWAGTSIGAAAAAHHATHKSFEEFSRVPYAWQAVWKPMTFWRSGVVVREMLNQSIDQRAHEELSGVLSVTVATLSWPHPSNAFFIWKQFSVTDFPTRKVLIDALAASAAIPGFTGTCFFNLFVCDWGEEDEALWLPRSVSVDGGIVANTPVFTDGAREQLVINLGFLEYSNVHTFTPTDPNHDELIRLGQDHALALLKRSSGGWAGGDAIDDSPLRVISADDAMVTDAYGAGFMRFIDLDAVPWVRSSLKYARREWVPEASSVLGAVIVAFALQYGLAQGRSKS